MCAATSPAGHLTCVNPQCNGHSHVWVHESSAPDRKSEADGQRLFD